MMRPLPDAILLNSADIMYVFWSCLILMQLMTKMVLLLSLHAKALAPHQSFLTFTKVFHGGLALFRQDILKGNGAAVIERDYRGKEIEVQGTFVL